MKPLVQYLILVITCLALAGCASDQTRTASTQPAAECLVCKHNADLACVNVAVDSSTPRTTYAGQTYYFCSDECKREFEKNPQKYAGK